jgi:indolepyruvate ferredoxin oxidoreductase
LKFLRGTPLDVFGWSSHRRMERSLAGWYMDLLRKAPLEEVAALPDGIRGYEGVKEASVERVRKLAEAKLGTWITSEARS